MSKEKEVALTNGPSTEDFNGTKDELKAQLVELTNKLEEAKSTANQNFDYAKQAHNESTEIREQAIAEGQKQKDFIQEVDSFLTQIELMLNTVRKSLGFILQKEYNPKRKEEKE